jgi:hypothetical protein
VIIQNCPIVGGMEGKIEGYIERETKDGIEEETGEIE